MNAENVTHAQPSEGTKARVRRKRAVSGLVLETPADGPSSIRVIQALHGVCQAAERAAEVVRPGSAD